jgi:hypothetical protein
MRVIIPRQLALETLDSLQRIFFPFDDGSRVLLSSLVVRTGLDPDCAAFDATEYRRESEADVQYHYWGVRLMKIFNEFDNPRRRGSVVRQWLQIKSGREYLMIVTFLTLFLGIGSLIVSAFQTRGDRKK